MSLYSYIPINGYGQHVVAFPMQSEEIVASIREFCVHRFGMENNGNELYDTLARWHDQLSYGEIEFKTKSDADDFIFWITITHGI